MARVTVKTASWEAETAVAAASVDNPQSAGPLDLAHLARQAMGDREIEREVLALFVSQSRAAAAEIRLAAPGERRRIAHTIKGAARGVGAFAVAAAAEALEADPGDHALIERFSARIGEACGFIATLRR